MDTREWYESLKKPSWAPEPKLFGQVWSVLYPIIFGVNVYIIFLLVNNDISWVAALPFWLNLGLNLAFSPIQFGLHNNALALIDIVAVLVTIIWSMIVIWPAAPLAALLFLPYLIWVGVATTLQTYITFNN